MLRAGVTYGDELLNVVVVRVRFGEVRRVAKEFARKLLTERGVDLARMTLVLQKQHHTRTPVMIARHFVIKSENLGTAADQSGGILHIVRDVVHDRSDCLLEKQSAEFKTGNELRHSAIIQPCFIS